MKDSLNFNKHCAPNLKHSFCLSFLQIIDFWFLSDLFDIYLRSTFKEITVTVKS